MAETNNEHQWYALRAISGKELKVKETLDAAIRNGSLGGYVSEVLVPTEKVYTTRAGKKVLKDRILLSGYVFVKAQLTGEVIFELRTTTNVIDFLRGRDKTALPEPIRESDMRRMIGAAESLETEGDGVVNDYIVGEKVKVNAGPFTNFIGEIEEVNREKRTLKVMVSVFGRKTPLELENSQVEREMKE